MIEATAAAAQTANANLHVELARLRSENILLRTQARASNRTLTERDMEDLAIAKAESLLAADLPCLPADESCWCEAYKRDVSQLVRLVRKYRGR